MIYEEISVVGWATVSASIGWWGKIQMGSVRGQCQGTRSMAAGSLRKKEFHWNKDQASRDRKVTPQVGLELAYKWMTEVVCLVG